MTRLFNIGDVVTYSPPDATIGYEARITGVNLARADASFGNSGRREFYYSIQILGDHATGQTHHVPERHLSQAKPPQIPNGESHHAAL